MQLERPLISVVIPAYNAERYLIEALKSVSAQIYSEFEIVVVDDGSSDSTGRLLQEYACDEPRMVVLSQNNAGISAALNAGIDVARGDFIARMDADDLMLPGRLGRQLACLQEQPTLGFCASAITFIDPEGRERGGYTPPVQSLEDLEFMIGRGRSFSFTHPTVMYRRAALEAVGPYNIKYEPCEDLELWLRMIDAEYPGIALPERLLRYRLHGNSISGKNLLRQIQTRNALFYNFYARRSNLTEKSAAEIRAKQSMGARIYQDWRDKADALRASGRYMRSAGAPLRGNLKLALGLFMSGERIPVRLFERAIQRRARAGGVSPSATRS